MEEERKVPEEEEKEEPQVGPVDPTVQADEAEPTKPGPGDSEGGRPDLLDPEEEDAARGTS